MALRSARPDQAAWLQGGEAHCNCAPPTPTHPRRLLLVGAPGVGKATQARLLADRLGLCHLSADGLFRNARQQPEGDQTPTMIIALEYRRNSAPVPDEIIQNLIIERSRCLRCKGGFVLEGFPHTAAQAESLDKVLTGLDVRLEAILHYKLPVEILRGRLAGRRTCPACQAEHYPGGQSPQPAKLCQQCGSRLNPAENPRQIRARLQAYQLNSRPLVKFYQQQGLLIALPADGTPEEVFERTLLALQKQQDR